MRATVKQLRTKITRSQKERILKNFRFYKVGHRNLHFLEKCDQIQGELK